jgi:hypothetical protein
MQYRGMLQAGCNSVLMFTNLATSDWRLAETQDLRRVRISLAGPGGFRRLLSGLV